MNVYNKLRNTTVLEYKKGSKSQYLHKSKEDTDGNHVVMKDLPESKEIEVWINILRRQQIFHKQEHCHGAVDIEANGKDGYLKESRRQ